MIVDKRWNMKNLSIFGTISKGESLTSNELEGGKGSGSKMGSSFDNFLKSTIKRWKKQNNTFLTIYELQKWLKEAGIWKLEAKRSEKLEGRRG